MDNVETIGSRLPLRSRRVVEWLGNHAKHETAIGLIEGLADGAILIRRRDADGVLEDAGIEITPEQARAVERALSHASGAVERWQERASGFNTIRVYRASDGSIEVEHRGRRRPMRLSVLRGHAGRPAGRECGACRQVAHQLWIAADEVREHGYRVLHAEVCQGCVDRLANLPAGLSEVQPLPRAEGEGKP